MDTRTLTIKQKPSNSGTIHDLASDMFDRVIRFPGTTRFAVVLAAYYGGRGYRTYTDAARAAAASRRLSRDRFSHAVIDLDGYEYDVGDNTLHRRTDVPRIGD